jgi:hypothetical protein
MAFLTVKTESVQQEGGSGYIQKSGIYDLTLKHCEIVTTPNGAVQANYLFDKVMSYGNNIIGTQGAPTYGYKILEALTATLGEDSLSDPEPTTVIFKTGSKEKMCIPELNGVAVKAWIQFKYRMYKGEIREDVVVKRFYRANDGASGSEVIDGQNIGDRLQKDQVVCEETIYEDGATPEAAAVWKKAQMSGGDSTTKPAPAKTGGFPGAAKAGFPGAK